MVNLIKSLILYLPFSLSSLVLAQEDSILIFFDNNSYTISPSAEAVIQSRINSENTIQISSIQGFTDINGSDEKNLILANNRVKSTKKAIERIGNAEFSNCKEIAHGEVAVPSSDYALDRRVLVIYTIQQKTLTELIEETEVGSNIAVKNMNFVGGEAILLTKSEPVIVELLDIMNANPKLKIRIEGHICCATIDEHNLSTRRAKMVYHYLIENGISPERLSYIGYGPDKPIYPYPEENPMQESANRRVEIVILEK